MAIVGVESDTCSFECICWFWCYFSYCIGKSLSQWQRINKHF